MMCELYAKHPAARHIQTGTSGRTLTAFFVVQMDIKLNAHVT